MERNDLMPTPATTGTPKGYEPPRVEVAKTGDDLAREAQMGVVTNQM